MPQEPWHSDAIWTCMESYWSTPAATRERRKRKRCERKQRRGKRAGIHARLKANPSRPAVTLLLLSRAKAGGLCIYINKDWCVNAMVAAKRCSQLAEFLIVKCQPFYLPREFSNVIVAVVYIAPSANANANANEALGELHDAISELVSEHLDSFVVVAGDFNHTSLKTVLPKFKQIVDFKTRGENMLDLVYTNSPDAYKAIPRSPLGHSHHLSIMLVPAYKPLLKHSKPVKKFRGRRLGTSGLFHVR